MATVSQEIDSVKKSVVPSRDEVSPYKKRVGSFKTLGAHFHQNYRSRHNIHPPVPFGSLITASLVLSKELSTLKSFFATVHTFKS